MAMHIRFSAVLSLAVTATLVVFASADVFERDHALGSGDGLLTYDDVNRREWLDVTVFAGKWSGYFTLSLALRDPAFDFTVEFPELAPGGSFDSFALADSEDVTALAESAGIDTTMFSPSNVSSTSQLIGLLGVTLNDTADGVSISAGLLDNFESGNRRISEFFLSNTAGLFLLPLGHGAVLRPEWIGLMLYRDAVPEPSAGVLFGIGAAVVVGTFLGVRRRRLPVVR